MSKYRVVVLESATGNTVFSRDVNAMIAGLANGDEVSSVLLSGTEDEMMLCINVVQSEIDKAMEI